MLISIAWKNIWRNKLRSSVVIVAVTLGMIGGIFTVSLMKGMTDSRISNAINYELAHIQIHNPKYLNNEETKFNVENSDKIINFLRKQENVSAVASRKKITGMASSAETGLGITIVGVNPEEERAALDLHEQICDTCGNYFRDKKKNRVVVSKKTAENLKVKLGQKIVLSFQDAKGNFTGGAFRIAGIYDSKNSMFEERYLFVKKDDLARLSAYPKNHVNEIVLKLKDADKLDAFQAKLAEKYTDLKVRSWKTLQPDLNMTNEFMDIVTYIFMLIILLALGFGIVNTMLMVVLERVREIGMLMAVGMNKKRVFSMIMFETIFLSIIGGIIGMFAAMGLNAYYGTYGLHFEQMTEGLEAIGYSASFYPSIEPQFYVILTLMIIATGIAAAIYPAVKALKLNPADAVRTDM